MEHGWFKMNRTVFTDDIICYSPAHLAVWCYLCANAAYKERQTRFAGKVIAAATKLDEYKVQRILSFFESAQRIAQQTSSTNRLISILPRDDAPESAQQTSQQTHGSRTPDAQRLHTIKKEEKDKNKNVNTSARAHARNDGWKKQKESVYSSDASYDLEAFRRMAREKMLNYRPHTDNSQCAIEAWRVESGE